MGKTVQDVQVTVPIIGIDGTPLMPCHPARARELIKKKGAIVRWFKGIYSLQLVHASGKNVQRIACGIDTGIVREAFTVQSKSHTYINVLSDGINHVHDRVMDRKAQRKARRRRKTPCRTPRFRRRPKRHWIAPSIIARWESRVRIINFLRKVYPLTDYVIEDVSARKFINRRRWNKNFSNLEMGKTLYYDKISSIGNLVLKKGFETSKLREGLGLKKIHNKMSEKFSSHNVDSWVLASFVTGRKYVDNKNVFRMVSFNFYRRKLHNISCFGHGVRNRYGGTTFKGYKKGSFVKHKKFGFLYVVG